MADRAARPGSGGAASTTFVVEVETPVGTGRWFVAPAEQPRALLALGHGAGGGVEAMDLRHLSDTLPAHGISVARFEQPWRTAGGKVAVAPPRLDLAWLAALPELGGPEVAAMLGGPLLVGGRSAGARVACRTATELGAAGVVCLAFPLHPPGRPEKSRLAELLSPTVPRLVLQGSSDSFGSSVEVNGAVDAAEPTAAIRIVDLPGADHGYRVAKASGWSVAELKAELTARVVEFVADVT